MKTKIGEIMAKQLVSVTVGTSLHSAAKLMDEKRIRHLPVVDASDAIVGILTKRDFSVLETITGLQVEHFMTAPVEAVSEDMPIKNAIYNILEKKISSLIVVSPNSNVAVGILTTDDLLFHLATLFQDDEPAAESVFSNPRLQTVGQVAHQLSMAGV
jgi:CBS domain-containing membrane protein